MSLPKAGARRQRMTGCTSHDARNIQQTRSPHLQAARAPTWTAAVIASSYWLAGRAVHRALTAQPQIEIELGPPRWVRSLAERCVRDAIASLDGEPWSDVRLISLMVASNAVRRIGSHEHWEPMLRALACARLPDRVCAAARAFSQSRWSCISILAAEIQFERVVPVSRVLEICGGIRLAA
jgi:hypothetical protein